MTALPVPRGTLSAAVVDHLRKPADGFSGVAELEPDGREDAALSLWMIHELSYLGFDEVEPDHERSPELLMVRRRLEDDLESALRHAWPGRPDVDLVSGFFDWIEEQDGPSLARFVRSRASREQVLHLLKVRSLYHFKEADATTWVIPRLPVAAKAALVELQYDEYGNGHPDRLHAHLFTRGMAACGLDVSHGPYVDDAPTEVLEQNNALSMFGLQRRLRAAALGHLAAFEATSSMPSRRMAQGLERLGLAQELVDYYQEHVVADAVHEQLAVRTICGGLVEAEPDLLDDVWFGAWACLELENRTATRMFAEWGVEA